MKPGPVGSGAHGSSHRLLLACSNPFTSPIGSPMPGKCVRWPPENEAVLLRTTVSYLYTTLPLNRSCSRLEGTGSDSWSESGHSSTALVCV